MKTVYALFDAYQDAATAVGQLLEDGFEAGQMNAIMQASVAKSEMDVNLETADVDVTDEVGRQRLFGLDKMLAGQQPTPIGDVGEVFAAGDNATLLARTASDPDAADGGLAAALAQFDIPQATAVAYRDGVRGGGLLFWIRTDDAAAANAAAALREHHGRHVG